MLTDSQIARNATLADIGIIAAKLGYTEDEIERYGHVKAKLPVENAAAKGKLILVTAMNPTPLGEGKTTVSISLADALNRIGKSAALALREPSLGPVFGIKGGACGGGYAQVVPMEDINLHFTGDFHAVTAANNLLSALIDNHIHQGNALDIADVIWRRCLDVNDRALRVVETGLGGAVNGVPRTDGFTITAASEIMSILCLASSLKDLKERLAAIVIGYNSKGEEIRARDLHAQEAMTLLLKDALKPNLVQTLEGTPALIHGGPFANIAHGCNSVIATRTALARSEYTVTEAGFGAELGGEKFIDIKCRAAGFAPACSVLVITARSVKFNGGVPKENTSVENNEALYRGFANVKRHLRNLANFNVPTVAAINRFASDSDGEIEMIKSMCAECGVEAVAVTGFTDGGKGAEELARKVVSICGQPSEPLRFAYPESSSCREKIAAIARNIYGAREVIYTEGALSRLEAVENKPEYSRYPVCIAKTQYSFSTDDKKLGAPEDFIFEVKDVIPRAGAGFIVVISGKIMLMPGLPASPNTERIKIDSITGEIDGLM